MKKREKIDVRFVPANRFPDRPPHKFKTVLNDLRLELEKVPDGSEPRVAEIQCETEAKAKDMQRGFHSSGTSRRFKEQGFKIETACAGKVVKVRLSRELVAVPA